MIIEIMIKNVIALLIFEIIVSQPICKDGENNCLKCNYLTNLCAKCINYIYSPDENGGCMVNKICEIGKNYCHECSDEKDLCKICEEGYFPDLNGGCSYTANCKISIKGECIECLDNYILIGGSTYHYDNFKICKSLNSEDFKNCEEINTEKGICSKCKENYFLNSGDYRCIQTQNCSESTFEICTKCEYGFYYDIKEKKCKIKDDNFLFCQDTVNGITCDKCDDGYYFSEDGKCTNINFCSIINENNQCEKCISNYYLLSNYQKKICTKTEHCSVGDSDTGLCLYCEENYFIDYKDGKCKSNQEDNEFKYCRTANGNCIDCIYDYFIGEDFKCSTSKNCSESDLGICQICSDNFHLGKDNICSNVEHCIYSDRYFECIECEGDYYYNIRDKECIIGENNYTNCKITNFEGNYCEICKDDFCLNQTEHTCFSNLEQGDFYKCAMTDSLGRFCVECKDNYYLGRETLRCSIINGCEKAEIDDSKCIECNSYFCLDMKTGKCEDNDFIEDEQKKFYYRCNRTNKEGTSCEICMEGFDLNEEGLCIDTINCLEKNDDGSCKICQKNEETYYFYCSNELFGCIETYDHYCLECNDILDFNKCTKCINGYELNEENICIEIENN